MTETLIQAYAFITALIFALSIAGWLLHETETERRMMDQRRKLELIEKELKRKEKR